MIVRTALLMMLAALASGCATRRPLALECLNFEAVPLTPGPILRSVLADQGKDIPEAAKLSESASIPVDSSPNEFTAVRAGADCDPLDPVLRALMRRRGLCRGGQNMTFARSGGPKVLILSGGGQWGAFGAAFLQKLDENGKLPAFDVITGISTGAMQSLILGDTKAGKLTRLLDEYTIADENEIVDRGPRFLAIIRGSIAGLEPLLAKTEKALCANAVVDAATSVESANCLLTRLASEQGPAVVVGFVEADTGRLMVADVNRLARAIHSAAEPPMSAPERLRRARTCVAAAAIASSAMPVFYQQLQVVHRRNGKTVRQTLLDGGVRQSVFLPAIAQRSAIVDERAGADEAEQTQIFVIRNGPTSGKLDLDANGNADALTMALAAYDIVVNQLEVSSIAGLRIDLPDQPIALATADGKPTDACVAERDASKTRKARMFDPDFMACLQRVGARKAAQPQPWLTLAKAERR